MGLKDSVFRAGHKYMHTNPIKNTKEMGKEFGGHMKKNYDLSEPLFKKDPEGRNLNNLWTGKTYGGKGRALATVSLLGGGSIIAANPRNASGLFGDAAEQQSEELDIESLQSTRSDGLGYQAQIGTKASEKLTTSGDLVFAMHKTRHSGQF
jgi:hypothetical protein